MQEQYEKVVDPVLSAVKRDCGAILATLHRLDFGKSGPAIGGGGASIYMEELAAKMNFVKQEILERYAGMDVVRQWCVSAAISRLPHDPSSLCRHILIFGAWLYQGNLHCEVRDKNFRLTRIDYKTAR